MKAKILKEIKELEDLYDWNLKKSEDIMYINNWESIEKRLHDLKIEINTYKKVLEMLEIGQESDYTWFDDADVQIIGFSVDNFDDMSIEERLEYFGIRKDITKINESLSYPNLIKSYQKENKELKIKLLEEQLKNEKLELRCLDR